MVARLALLGEIVRLSLDTLRSNLLRSALTILGVVIGVMSIVSMTAMIRGFGNQMETLFQQMGTHTVYVAKMSITSFAAGKKFWDLMKRPDIDEFDARAIKEQAPSAKTVTYHLGEGPASRRERFVYRNASTKEMGILGVDSNWLQVNFLKVVQGRFISEHEVQHRRPAIVLGDAPAAVLFPHTDPIGKRVRFGSQQYEVVGVLEKRPSLLGAPMDEFGVIPSTTFDKNYKAPRWRGYLMRFLVISVVAREGASRDDLMREIESVMRSRHRLKLDQENDFDMVTSDSLMKMVRQMTSAIVLALVTISSIALTVGGIGVMAIMSISVTERTREIGIRRAVGATRSGILWQFLIEAVVVTSLGGLLGALVGAGIGVVVNVWAGFPLALPWWSFALGIGFSALVGLFFGLFPAFKAANLDPIEALRHE
jgi:putative ABC transport system permease protein